MLIYVINKECGDKKMSKLNPKIVCYIFLFLVAVTNIVFLFTPFFRLRPAVINLDYISWKPFDMITTSFTKKREKVMSAFLVTVQVHQLRFREALLKLEIGWSSSLILAKHTNYTKD